MQDRSCEGLKMCFPWRSITEVRKSRVEGLFHMSVRILFDGHLRHSELHGVEVHNVLYFPPFWVLFPSHVDHEQVRSKFNSPSSDDRNDARSELRRVKGQCHHLIDVGTLDSKRLRVPVQACRTNRTTVLHHMPAYFESLHAWRPRSCGFGGAYIFIWAINVEKMSEMLRNVVCLNLC